jgi:malto-oligosyltrehalose trehalohydrolase
MIAGTVRRCILGREADGASALPPLQNKHLRILLDMSLTDSDSEQQTELPTERPSGFGAVRDGDQIRFRLFAPASLQVHLDLIGLSEPLLMQADGSGWHELLTPAASPGSHYRYLLEEGTSVPDPASRYQPKDVHGPTQVMDPGSYDWQDGEWHGLPWNEAILYELHVGAFTKAGTFNAARQRLPHLAELGITGIELMCVSDFAGNRNWGYDGVLPYAPDSAYGTPDEMKAFIDSAHALGIMIILDVVYNHFGPEGNFLSRYFPDIYSDRHDTPWGNSLNFDGPRSDVVREFIIRNALYWVDEFHVDGIRLDASHAMVDESPRHVLDELRDRVAASVRDRPVHLILESEQNIACRLGRDNAGTPLNYSAQWNHDITHLLGAAYCDLGGASDNAETERLCMALGEGFNIAAREQGAAQDCNLPPTAFVAFLQTHDLVGNRIFGDRLTAHASSEIVCALSSVYLLLPQIPMLFMGEEWGTSRPFPFFCDYHGELADQIRRGRVDQLKANDPAPSEDELRRAPDPQAESTFRSAQLSWDELSKPEHSSILDWYRRLIEGRREHVIPLLNGLTGPCSEYHAIAPAAFTITWSLCGGVQLTLAANLCNIRRQGFPPLAGKVIWTTGRCSNDGQLGAWSVCWSIAQS